MLSAPGALSPVISGAPVCEHFVDSVCNYRLGSVACTTAQPAPSLRRHTLPPTRPHTTHIHTRIRMASIKYVMITLLEHFKLKLVVCKINARAPLSRGSLQCTPPYYKLYGHQ